MAFKTMRREAGYTLLEIMIVLVILSILTGMGVGLISSMESRGDLELVVEEMRELTALAEQARILPGGANFIRATTAQVATLVDSQGGAIGSTSKTIDRVSPYGDKYYITTQGKVTGIVETDVDLPGFSPVGLGSKPIGGKSRIMASHRPRYSNAQTQSVVWTKKLWYCEGHTPSSKPAYCP